MNVSVEQKLPIPYRTCLDTTYNQFRSRFGQSFMQLGQDWPEDKWMIEGLFMTGGKVNFITGQSKSGKSRYMMWMLVHMLEGMPLWQDTSDSWVTRRPRKIVWLLGEERQQDIERRLQRYAELQGFDWGSWTTEITFIEATGLGLDKVDTQASLERMIREQRPDLIIGDPFRRLHDAAENSNDDMKGITTWFRIMANKYGVDFWIVHHTGMVYENQRYELANINFWFRGATDVPSIVDGACFLWRNESTPGTNSGAPVQLYRGGRAGEWMREIVDKGMSDIKRPIETDRGWELA